MNGALGYLLVHSAKNRLRGQISRLRRPRYLLAVLAGGAYFGTLLFNSRMPSPLAGSTSSALGQLIYTAIIFVTVASGWIFGSDRPALVFSEAEVQLIFPAPLSRASLVRYKVAQAQLVVLFSVIIWVILLRRGGMTLPFWMRAISLWVILSTLYLHRVGASLVRTSAASHGARGVRSNLVPIVIVVAAIAVVGWTIVRAVPGVRAAMMVGESGDAFAKLSTSQPLATILYPFHLLVTPLFADSWRQWLRAIVPAFVLMAAHYPWVTRTDAAFEEAVADAAARRARAAASTRGARRRPMVDAERAVPRAWFALAPTGHPAVAIVWKNVLAYTRTLRLTTLAILVVGVGVIGSAVYTQVGDWHELAAVGEILCAIPLGMLVVLGPGFVRADLRQDLLQLDQLRSYPLRGSTIVAAEIASTTAILTAMQYLLLAVATLLASYDPNAPVPVAPAALIALVALPTLNAITLTVANGAALLFPGWVRLGDGRTSGIEAMGQNVLAIFVSLILTTIAIVPPFIVTVLVAGAVDSLTGRTMSIWSFVPAAPVGALLVLGELWLVLGWLGRVFARTDLAQIDPPG
ncbi:MAG TPA: putative ABC exporter domain-containing protein [Gemmatimonadaceae bacterium]|nr:putative ABC exporter domain-containing protein [Gemmatimonadaceae bacterium]